MTKGRNGKQGSTRDPSALFFERWIAGISSQDNEKGGSGSVPPSETDAPAKEVPEIGSPIKESPSRPRKKRLRRNSDYCGGSSPESPGERSPPEDAESEALRSLSEKGGNGSASPSETDAPAKEVPKVGSPIKESPSRPRKKRLRRNSDYSGGSSPESPGERSQPEDAESEALRSLSAFVCSEDSGCGAEDVCVQGVPTRERRRREEEDDYIVVGDDAPVESEGGAGEEEEEEEEARETEEEEEEDDDDQEEFNPDAVLDCVLERCEECARRLCEHIEAHKGRGAGGPPACVRGELREHQLEGVNWLRLVHACGLNAILGDEMGLGKTVQAVAFLGALLEAGVSGPHLVLVPASTLENWRRELAAWCPALRVLVYYGAQREREELRAEAPARTLAPGGGAGYNVVLTTYTVATARRDAAYLRHCRFCYFVVDEAHNLRNAGSKRYEALLRMPCERRLLLTGTPLQNSLGELWALLQFLLPDLVPPARHDAHGLFRQLFRGPEADAVARLRQIVRPFLLRRLKADVAGAAPAPAKTRRTVACDMPPRQRALYAALVARSRGRLGGRADGELAALVNNVIMELRKVANHPLLVRALYSDADVDAIAAAVADRERGGDDRRFAGVPPAHTAAELRSWSDLDLHDLCAEKPYLAQRALPESAFFDAGKVRALERVVADTAAAHARPDAGPTKILVFSQMTRVLDILGDVCAARSWPFLRLDGSTPVSDRQSLAAGLGINLTSADTVVFYDVSFNPQDDRQAEDRCHRIGQTRDVTVVRLLSADTVDTYMLKLANEKELLYDKVLEEGVCRDDDTDPSAPRPQRQRWMSKMIKDLFSDTDLH